MVVNRALLTICTMFLLRIEIYACGPFFPEQLLVNRTATLSNLIEGTFFFEAAHLVEPLKDYYSPEQTIEWYFNPEEHREKIETLWFGENTLKVVKKMREAASADEAYRIGAGIPEAVRCYASGAVAFKTGNYSEALQRFKKVMLLPQDKKKNVGLWAQFMIGRSYKQLGDSANALKEFQAVRTYALQGAADSLGLALASLGEEASVYLSGNDYSNAIARYASQAACGSESGMASLLFVARQIVADDSLLVRMLPDTLCQKLVFAYLYCRSNEINESQEWSDSANSGKLLHVLDIVEKSGLNRLSGIDKLAAAAYRAAQFDLAQKLCEKTSTGLSWWVRAKLDLHKNKLSEAAKDYHEALKNFPANLTWYFSYESGPVVPSQRIQGELSAVYLSKGEFMTAMKSLYESSPKYWMDAAYVAEKILSVDELKIFVDENVKTANTDSIKKDSLYFTNNSAAAIRYLLARRLLREKRFKDALQYFDDQRIKQKARLYADYYRKANSTSGVKSASNWYQAAKLARFDGMELLGYELDPDYHMFLGEYSLDKIDSNAISCKFVSSDEYSRLHKNQLKSDKRFFYRYVAIEYIKKAASQVPSRSQAYVAMLSHAYQWISYTDSALGQMLYADYIHNGAYVQWAFERNVPEPDFREAQSMVNAEKIKRIKSLIKKYLKLILLC